MLCWSVNIPEVPHTDFPLRPKVECTHRENSCSISFTRVG